MRAVRFAVALSLLVSIGYVKLPSAQDDEAPGLEVGVFDSRALAVAYAASDVFGEQLAELREEKARLEERGDTRGLEKIEAEGRARQARLHRQGFSTAPVDDILAHIEASLPGIAERASVDVIVSKWQIAYSAKNARFVDVTDRLVELLDPDERTLRSIRELRDRDPMPLYETDWAALEKH